MNFTKRSVVPVTPRELFDWHGSPGAFARLTPPWQTVEVLREDPGLGAGKRVELDMGTPLGKRRWVARHTDCVAGSSFTDTQESGPFRVWTHRHRFLPVGERSAELVDEIDFELPLGAVGKLAGASYVRGQLGRSFAYRHWVTKRDLELKAALPNFRSLKVVIAGGSGFLGTQLSALLSAQGHEVSILTRSKTTDKEIHWDPFKCEIDLARLEGVDAVVNLAGESLTSGRWNAERKKRLWCSRVDATDFLVYALERLERPPSVFLSGSGIGIYGSDPEKLFVETDGRGEGFLAELCEAWEAAALRAETSRTRVCMLRTGVVIDPRGGALREMLPAFRLGGGGPLGGGEQWFPWIGLEDWIGAVNWLLFAEAAKGPVNLVSPEALRQGEFAKVLGSALCRPAVLPVPRFALSLLLGQMADEALLSSIRARPAVLQAIGYQFALPGLKDALSRVL